VKLDVDTLPTVPDAPPDAGPDRALDPRPPADALPAAVAEGDVAVAEGVPQAAESPITTHVSAAGMIHRLVLFDSNRRTPDVALETGRAGPVSWGFVGAYSFMMAFLLLRQ
jgi:hypothetical protein